MKKQKMSGNGSTALRWSEGRSFVSLLTFFPTCSGLKLNTCMLALPYNTMQCPNRTVNAKQVWCQMSCFTYWAILQSSSADSFFLWFNFFFFGPALDNNATIATINTTVCKSFQCILIKLCRRVFKRLTQWSIGQKLKRSLLT